MSAPDRLPREALDGLLDGSPSDEVAGTPLAEFLAAVRDEAAATTPTPSDQLHMVLAEGLEPSEVGAHEATAAGGVLVGWRGRGRLVARALVTKFAALGLVAKMAATGAAVTVATSGAGAAGVLPPPAQSTFDDVVGREAPAQAEGDDQGVDVEEAPPAPPANTSTTPPLETDVPGDATGTSDREPGVDGAEVGDDASGDQRAPDEDAPEESPADGRTDDTPARDRVGETPASDPPAEREAPPTEAGAADQEDRDEPEQDAGTERAERDAGEQRPDASPSEQAEPDQRRPES